jgi:hypothetical protein
MSNPDPIFKNIFGAAWADLPPVMKKHYANRPYSDDLVTIEGVMDVFCAGPIKMFWRLFLLMKSIPPFCQEKVPTIVHFRSDPRNNRFYFCRNFHFAGRPPYFFNSYMVQVKQNEIIEVTAGSMGWRALYSWEGGKVVMRHKGYAIKIGRFYLPLPLAFLIGEGYAEEIAVDDNHFDMCMHLAHPKWGKIYEYKGRFKVTKQA